MSSKTPDPSSSLPDERGVFARSSTGLVREASARDAFMNNMSASAAPLALVLLFALGPAYYVGGNMFVAVFAALLLTIPIGLVYAMFATAIPRSGGDYTWISRSLSPTVGFASNFSYMFWGMFIIAIYGVLVATWGLGPLLRYISVEFDAPRALDLADWLTGKWGTFTVGAVLMVLSALLLMFTRGLRVFLRVQGSVFFFWALFLVVVPAVVFLVKSKSGFQGDFDAYARQLGATGSATEEIIKAAGSSPDFSWKQSLLLVTLPFYAFGFVWPSSYWAGEIKRGARTHFLAMPGTQLGCLVVFLVLILTVMHSIGDDFLRGAALADPTSYGFASVPYYPEMAAIAVGNSILGVLILVSFILFLAIAVPITLIFVSRSLFAWSFDRLFPEWLSDVNRRTRTPLNALGVLMVVGILMVAVVAYNPSLGALVVLMGQTLTFACVGLAAVFFPYRQADVFEASPFNWRFRGVPVMSLLGALTFVCTAILLFILATDLNSGTAWETEKDRVTLVVGLFVGAGVVYQLIRLAQRARGYDPALAYREIPPE